MGLGLSLPLLGCDKGADSFSTLPDQASFQQVAVYAPKKIDVLWVIDNSGSMATSQANIATNFNSFIHRFIQYNYDFHMAIVTTDGWHEGFYANNTDAHFRDGLGANHSGVYVMDKNTPNITSVFTTNVQQGINGDGDERAFESMKLSLSDSWNGTKNFRRADAFLAVIMVGDEDDFSNSTTGLLESYTDARVYPISRYTDFLDTVTARAANSPANYSVSHIGVTDQACLNQLDTDGFQRKIGNRYKQLVDAANGIQGSLCSDFGNTLQLISDSIIELSASFQLSRAPIVSSLQVSVDGVQVSQDATNGWTYDSATLTLTFHGTSVPPANADIKIFFDPESVKQ